MITISALSTKGGSGKTTLIQMLATAALHRGLAVHMLDGDTDKQLTEWQDKSNGADWGGLDRLPWPENLTVSDVPADVESLYQSLTEWEEAGIDVLLIDTRPGENEDTEDVALASDMILVPAVPVQSDFIAAHKTLAWIVRMIDTLADDDPAPLFRAVLTNAGKSAIDYVAAPDDIARARALQKVHAQDREVYEVINTLPLLATPVPSSAIIKRMPLSGPLTLVRDTYARDPNRALQVGYLKSAIDICSELLSDIEGAVEATNA